MAVATFGYCPEAFPGREARAAGHHRLCKDGVSLVYWWTLEELICGRIRGQGHRDDRVQDEVRSL